MGALGKQWRRVRAALAEDETVIVTRGARRAGWRLMIFALLTFVTGITAVVVVQGNNPWLQIPASMWLAALVGWSALGRQKRARAYWTGWLAGRMQMVSSLGEARRREMDMVDWLEAELDRDFAVIDGKVQANKGDPRD